MGFDYGGGGGGGGGPTTPDPLPGAKSFILDSGETTNADIGVYATWDEVHAAARAWTDDGAIAEIVYVAGSIPGQTYDCTGFAPLRCASPASFVVITDEDTVLDGLVGVTDGALFLSGAQAGRTTPVLGSGSTTTVFYLRGYGAGIYATGAYAGAVPAFRSQTANSFIIRVQGDACRIGFGGGTIVDIDVTGQFDVIDVGQRNTLDLAGVTGSPGDLFRAQTSDGLILEGTQPAGVVEFDLSPESYMTGQIVESARSGSRPIGDFLRMAGNLAGSTARGTAIFRDGRIREFNWIGTTAGGAPGDPIGLDLLVIRSGAVISVTTVDCPSTATNTPVTLPAPIDVQAGDALALRLATASTGAASSVSNSKFAAEVTP